MKRTIAFSDLHGRYDLWAEIRDYYNKNDTLIFLGDACDRGNDGIKIMQEMLQDPRVIYLKGNHEDMFLKFLDKGLDNLSFLDKEYIKYNECSSTINNFKEMNKQEQDNLITLLKEKTYFSYIYINKDKKNIFLSHAGVDFSQIGTNDINKLIWTRFNTLEKKWNNKYKYWYIIHGHTPVQTVKSDPIPKVLRYENKHKINIDMGSYWSNIAATIDLDTLQVKYFKSIGGENEFNDTE